MTPLIRRSTRRNKTMRKHRRTYTYRVTHRGIDYLMVRCGTVPESATFGDDWSIYRRHDTKHSPFDFELWINDTILVDRWTVETIRQWRQMGYIVSHADMWRKHIRYTEKLLSKTSISKKEPEEL